MFNRLTLASHPWYPRRYWTRRTERPKRVRRLQRLSLLKPLVPKDLNMTAGPKCAFVVRIPS